MPVSQAPRAGTSARALIACSRRSLIDLLDFLRELHAKGVDLFLHQQGLDTSTPSGRAMFQMLGVFAEFERGITPGRRWKPGYASFGPKVWVS
jgi:hypothetical protein